MSIYTQGLRKKPTYEELIDEIQTDTKVILPNRKAKFLRDSPYMSFLDEESYQEMEDQTMARNKHLQAEQVIQQQASQGGETASVLRATRPEPPPHTPPQAPNLSSAGAVSQGTFDTVSGYVMGLVNRIQQGEDKNTQKKSQAMTQLFNIGSPTVSGIPMETDDPFKTSNPAQKRSIEDPDPNYGNVVTKPKSKPKPTPKAMSKPSPKLQPAVDPSASSKGSGYSGGTGETSDPNTVKPKPKKGAKAIMIQQDETGGTGEQKSTAIQANILKTSAGSTKDKTYKKRHWTNMNLDELQAKAKQLGIPLTEEQLSDSGKGRYTKDKLANIIMDRLNKS